MTTSAPDRDDWYERPDDLGESGRARALWRWLPILVALIAFELTLNPMLAVVLACFRFGDSDFATAWWLLRRDTWRSRAWACAGFHIAWGFVRVLAAGLAAMMIACLLAIVAGMMNAALVLMLVDQVKASLMTIGGAGVACLLASTLGVVAAWIGGPKVWVSITTHHAREASRWPPLPEAEPLPETNRVMVTTAIAGVFAEFALMLATGLACRWAGLGDRTFRIALGVTMLLGTLGMLASLVPFQARFSARRPSECWPPKDGGIAG